MRISLHWLEEFVPLDVPVEKLVELLDMSGTKVEAVHPPQDVGGVVVAEVTGIEDHPDADNLVLVDVRTDASEERVVCGARNFAVGDRVPLAQVGARLGEMAVSERKIRGQVSRGMLCSGFELGISKDHSGILVLAADAELGSDVRELLGLDDTVLELELTPNRPDCMSMIGIAREVAALLGNELKLPANDLVASSGVASDVVVDIEDANGCPRYLARFISDVKMGPSPTWMVRRLLAGGVRPISNVVDATNYVMLEVGHSLHAFDARQIHNHRIVVRRARDGERLATLDGIERRLSREDLVIADKKRALAIAGIMGGEDSEVVEDTTDVILECAYFDPGSIALTSRRHLLRTEASARFERGADPEAVPVAAARCAQLMAELAGGRVAEAVSDEYPRPVSPPSIELRPARTTQVLGLELSPSVQTNHLRSIGLEVTEADGRLQVRVPTFRPDLQREIDLIEEVARLAGYERLPSTIPPGIAGGLSEEQRADLGIRRALSSFGLHEAWTLAFSSSYELDALGLPDEHPTRRMVQVENPMSEAETSMRTTLLPGLLRSVARNLAHGQESVALFEMARVFEPSSEQLPTEAAVLAAAFCGVRQQQGWNVSPREWDFFAVKGVVEAMCSGMRLPRPTFEPIQGMPFHPTRGARVSLDGAVLGVLGELHPDVCERFDVAEGTLTFEFALAPLFAALPRRVEMEDLSRFPPIYLDIAIIVDTDVTARRAEEVLTAAGSPELASARLFDLYAGEQVPEGSKSLAFALELRRPDRTLTDEEANVVRDRIVAALSSELGAQLRG
jgi:phenylalanyl-tRNA synthetase beta chain